jgi:serine/threonine protein kinase
LLLSLIFFFSLSYISLIYLTNALNATGRAVPIQVPRSWNFRSKSDLAATPTPTPAATPCTGNSKIGLVMGLIVLGLLVVLAAAIIIVVWVLLRRNTKVEEEEEDEESRIQEPMDVERIEVTGPKEFEYGELLAATNNFSERGRLGKGGFGSVYKGSLAEQKMEIAVKKWSRDSHQGKKEYISEVKTISGLRHRNLVQLVGWSQKCDSFLLAYEYMPNGSLDYHLFIKKSHLPWPVRYEIAKGLAAGLLYLHEGVDPWVLHRDIKSSNVLLDSNFNPKLGDFGLARFVGHGRSSLTTVGAGTIGYIAPECFSANKASKESDVFSFGVVLLEIACGRKVVEPEDGLVKWMWGFYERGRLLEAADEKLNGEYEKEEMKHLMSVGLWCANPYQKSRPSVRQAIQVLNFEAPLPSLPSHMPKLTYHASPRTTSTKISSSLTGEVTNQPERPVPSGSIQMPSVGFSNGK